MPQRSRPPKPGADWYLPEETYKSVLHFCYSYNELLAEAKYLGGLSSRVPDGMPHGTGVSNPTAKQAIKLAEIKRKIGIIERAVKATAPDIVPWLFLAVTDKEMTQELLAARKIPCNHKKLSQYKREVYWRIAQEL